MLELKTMPNAESVLDHQYLEMRWRALSLAADLDRIQRAAGGTEVIRDDLRLFKLRRVFELLLSDTHDRAEQVQMILSDATPWPE